MDRKKFEFVLTGEPGELIVCKCNAVRCEEACPCFGLKGTIKMPGKLKSEAS